MLEIVRIPEERKAVLIGKNGTLKKEIEKKAKVKIVILADVEIEGGTLDVLKAAEIVKAIGRGFNPKIALLLLGEEYELCIITLHERGKPLKRIVARIIGTKGRTRNNIEEWTGAHVSVYGKTVGIIGKHDDVVSAENALELLIEGKSHSYVYGRMRKAKKFNVDNFLI